MESRLIEILGSGCAKCDMLANHAEQAAKELGLDYTMIKLKDPSAWARHGVMMTPALVVDGKLKLQGRVLSAEKLKELLALP
jgi:small redox-active disulfide protein 2